MFQQQQNVAIQSQLTMQQPHFESTRSLQFTPPNSGQELLHQTQQIVSAVGNPNSSKMNYSGIHAVKASIFSYLH